MHSGPQVCALATETPGIWPAPGSPETVLVRYGNVVCEVVAGRDSGARKPRISFAHKQTEALKGGVAYLPS